MGAVTRWGEWGLAPLGRAGRVCGDDPIAAAEYDAHDLLMIVILEEVRCDLAAE